MVSWKNIRDQVSPGVWTIIGVLLGWWITSSDAEKQINALNRANKALDETKTSLHEQNGSLKTQNQLLLDQAEMLKRQEASVAELIKGVAAARNDASLALTSRGVVTLRGQPVLDSHGRFITDSQGRFLTADSSQVTADSPGPIN